MNEIKAIQFNGQELPEGADWDMGGTWVTLPDKTRKYIMPGDWLIGENGQYSEVLDNSAFNEKYSVEVIIKHKTNNYMTENAANSESKVLSFGEKAVGITFNPGKHEEVEAIKRRCADLIDYLNNSRAATESGDKKRMYSEAITAIQTGQMWAVKAATWQY